MHTAVVFYFSGTGNTWWVADRIIRRLDMSNINATAVSVDTVTPKKADWWIKTADLVLFGWPVYGSDLPEPMKRFLGALPKLEKSKHVHVFCTQMGFSGDGAWLAHQWLAEKGLIIDTAQHFTMPSNMSMMRGFFGTPDENRVKKIMASAETQVDGYVERLLTNTARIQGRFSAMLGMLQRVPFRLYRKKARRLFNADAALCTRCGLCESLCPMRNITIKDAPEFADRCAFCLRCYSFCPANAIAYKGRIRDAAKYGKPYSVPDKRFKPLLLIKQI